MVMVAKVYGRFVPSSQERDRWEKIAAKLDAERWGGTGVAMGVADEKVDELSDVTPDPDDSRGGTRTHDPGIMSAVL